MSDSGNTCESTPRVTVPSVFPPRPATTRRRSGLISTADNTAMRAASCLSARAKRIAVANNDLLDISDSNIFHAELRFLSVSFSRASRDLKPGNRSPCLAKSSPIGPCLTIPNRKISSANNSHELKFLDDPNFIPNPVIIDR